MANEHMGIDVTVNDDCMSKHEKRPQRLVGQRRQSGTQKNMEGAIEAIRGVSYGNDHTFSIGPRQEP